ncbi:hypothetical protein TRIUR3_34273 [Triticum urartu]|uniref:Uncharacterized protein n=1 Tax=Triticum urartu TaxID=4572 RepID=M8A5E4_TRIUA|nr:hypothetical protein TRIUR3_34273 [Triticum urartu]
MAVAISNLFICMEAGSGSCQEEKLSRERAPGTGRGGETPRLRNDGCGSRMPSRHMQGVAPPIPCSPKSLARLCAAFGAMGRKEIMEPSIGGPKEIRDLVSGKQMETIGLGSGKLQDYPLVRRLRNRRLLTYLWLQGFDAAYDRASLNWILVREKASFIADDLALESPELRRKLLLPGGPGLPQDLFPISPLRPRRHWTQQFPRPKPEAIAKCYLKRRRSLPSASPLYGLPDNAVSRVSDLIEGCLKAGKLPELHRGNPLQSNAKEGASGTSLLQTMFGTVTSSSENTGTSSVTNAGAPTSIGQPCPWCSSVANSGAAVSQPIKIPWITSATNAAPIKCLRQDGWCTNSATQGSAGRGKNSGEDLMTFEEDGPDRKRQRTKLELVTEVEARSCSANLTAY